ncbi:hypothetical protein C804_06319 [Lachnospiraceae bacterium A4]|nr:hypothetical protein C804_06319 [Lachnospiraceae bacterium A4]
MENQDDILYIVAPAYNEEDNIEKFVKEWYGLLPPPPYSELSRLVIADSGSSDSTHAILNKLKERYPKLEILSDTKKEHGPKVIALYEYAIEKGADYIFQTDSDNQTSSDEFWDFWEARNKFDGIFGYRNTREDGCFRSFTEKVVCLLLKIYFKIDVPDANAPFRLMKCDKVKKYLCNLPLDYNLPNIMMTTYFVYYKEKVDFLTISFKSRKAGTNSVNVRKIIKIGWQALWDFHKLRKNMNKEFVK